MSSPTDPTIKAPLTGEMIASSPSLPLLGVDARRSRGARSVDPFSTVITVDDCLGREEFMAESTACRVAQR